MGKELRNNLYQKLNEFINKYYKNLLIKGGIFSLSSIFFFFLVFAFLEHIGQFGTTIRTLLFWGYLFLNGFIIYKYVFTPLLQLNRIGKFISYEKAAEIIGNHFQDIDDKLINILQLEQMDSSENSLIFASIEQKIRTINTIKFSNAINMRGNRKHIKLVAFPIIIVLLFIIGDKKHILSESSSRIIKHNTFFEPKAPFRYIFEDENLETIQYEDFRLRVSIEGEMLPNTVFLLTENNKIQLTRIKNNVFEYLFKSVNSNIEFQLNSAGYYSKPYIIKVIPKPIIVNFSVDLDYPHYTSKKDEQKYNIGDFSVPEGTNIKWCFEVINTDTICMIFKKNPTINCHTLDKCFENILTNSQYYKIKTKNNFGLTDSIKYHTKVIPDKFPKIIVEQLYDTLSGYHIFNGELLDDYAVTELTFNLNYKNIDSVIHIPLENISQQLLYFSFNFYELKIDNNDPINYYFELWDNDEINGRKSVKSNVFQFNLPTKKELIIQKDKATSTVKSSLSESLELAKELQQDITELNKDLIDKKKAGWKEKMRAKEILEKQQELQKKIQNLQKENSIAIKKQEQINSSILDKQKKLQELMEKIFDDEMKNLLAEMEELLNESDKEKIKQLMEKLEDENINLENELDRDLELFKQLEFEQKLEEAINKANQIKLEQKNLKEKSKNKNSKNTELAEQQSELKKEMEMLSKELNNLEQKNQELEQKNKTPDTENIEEKIKDKMKISKESLEKNKRKKSQESQEEAIQKLDELENTLKDLQNSCSSSEQQENSETLREILENLITLSFEQEELMVEVQQIPKNSPEFLKAVQKQKKLTDDSKLIADSLFALSKRALELEPIINKQITSINSNMQSSTIKLEDRQVEKAREKQQFVMTATNNLALLLTEILEQMQKDMASKTPGKKQCNKPGGGKPSLSELKKQQQQLNEQMKKGEKGKSGKKKPGGKEAMRLMNLAKKQEHIRTQLEKLRNNISENEKRGDLNRLINNMEKNEIDIINNNITNQTIRRQEDILNKLLEAEKASREQDEEEKRESIEWNFSDQEKNKILLNQNVKKEKQKELLQSTPIQLRPFYKKKVNQYFNNLLKEQE